MRSIPFTLSFIITSSFSDFKAFRVPRFLGPVGYKIQRAFMFRSGANQDRFPDGVSISTRVSNRGHSVGATSFSLHAYGLAKWQASCYYVEVTNARPTLAVHCGSSKGPATNCSSRHGSNAEGNPMPALCQGPTQSVSDREVFFPQPERLIRVWILEHAIRSATMAACHLPDVAREFPWSTNEQFCIQVVKS